MHRTCTYRKISIRFLKLKPYREPQRCEPGLVFEKKNLFFVVLIINVIPRYLRFIVFRNVILKRYFILFFCSSNVSVNYNVIRFFRFPFVAFKYLLYNNIFFASTHEIWP